jgi:uncharacterized alpha-E superfamily protein
MISRVADCCFWLGRYLERAESTARLLQVTASLALDGDLTARQCWHPVIITAGEEAALVARHGEDAISDGERVQAHLAIDRDVGVSIVCSVAAARENARSIREVISLEVWESLNELHLFLQSEAASAAWVDNRYELYRRVRTEVQLVLGLLRGTMLHDAPMYFAWLGVLLERTGQTARILDVHHHAFTNVEKVGASDTERAIAVGHWLSLLRACYGFEPFMKIHRGPVTGEAVASFLVFESRFPRAVRYCVLRARETMLGTRPPEIAPLRALALLDRLDADLLRAKDSSLDAARLHALLTDVVDTTHAISASIADELFGVAPAASSASREATPVASQSQSQSPSQGASQRQSQHGSQG